MKRKFREIKLNKNNKLRLNIINEIIEDYQDQGYVLTLRQLYYQLVSRDIIPNKQKEYSKLSTLLKEGRMAGVVDWSAIEDRLRQPYKPAAFDSPEDIVDAAISQYQLPRQENQNIYLEVWVEKDALSGVLKRVTSKYHIPIMVNRGYSSVSAMYDAFLRFVNEAAYKSRPVKILYLGDFDPSGIDMIRDIHERIIEFQQGYNDGYMVEEMEFSIKPIALTRNQIKEHDPPPNPAKVTDPRAKDFISKYGNESWEVDALKPEILHEILESEILYYIDSLKFDAKLNLEAEHKGQLENLKKYL